jgi:hypothetical protein
MFVREDVMEGEVAAYKEASPGDSEGMALVNDMPRVVEASAVGAGGVVWGGGAVADGVVALERMARDDLKCGALEAA